MIDNIIETGKRIKDLRIENNLSQTQFSLKIGVANNTVSQYETGKSYPSIEVLIKIAKLFDTTTDYLLGLTDNT